MAGYISVTARLATPAAADMRKRRRDRSCDTELSLISDTAEESGLAFYMPRMSSPPRETVRNAWCIFRVTSHSEMSDVALLALRCFHQHGMHRLQYFIG
jgi:hypothetical protein